TNYELRTANYGMSVLVTGGAGFIGSHVVDLLLADGVEVTVLDNLDPQVHGEHVVLEEGLPPNLARHAGRSSLRFLRGDVREAADVERALEGVDAVVHLAAAVGVGQSMYAPHYYTDVNVGGQGRLMEAMAASPERYRKLEVASSMSIYGEGAYRCPEHGVVEVRPRPESQLARGEWEPRCPECGASLVAVATPESKPTQHTSVYAVTKKSQEELALSFGPAYGIGTVALRFFNVYGSRQALSNPYTGVAAIFMSRLKNGNPPLIFEDGEQSRDFIHVSDVARAVRAALDAPERVSGAFNVCTGRRTAVVEVARALARRLGVDVAPEVVGRYRAGDIRHCYGDPAAAAELLQFRAEVDFEAGLDELLAWAEAQEAEDRVVGSFEELEGRGLVR
ncbi:MAG TPA: NAD-dependent epimerase/dehydratase family protein, partial [Longimicrobiales bacterium]|nr:NAD-dependent epimerase/dehydratase family protein [Longimicrobiales bacterium]